MSQDEFEQWVNEGGQVATAFEPFAYFNTEGKEIEVHLSQESYFGEWINPSLTIYRGEKSGKIVGLVIGAEPDPKLLEAFARKPLTSSSPPAPPPPCQPRS